MTGKKRWLIGELSDRLKILAHIIFYYESLRLLEPAPDCLVVYFNEEGQTFSIKQVKVPVFQKEKVSDVLVCSCFGWSHDRI